MPDLKTYSRQSEETPASWQAFQDFLTLKARSLKKLHKYYETASSPPTKSMNTLRNWRDRYGWTARSSDFDSDQGLRQVEMAAAAQAQEDAAELGQYQRIHRDFGVAGVQICMTLMGAMAEYVRTGKTVNSSVQIDSINELTKIATIVSKIKPDASESWAAATAVKEMLTLWQEMKAETDKG